MSERERRRKIKRYVKNIAENERERERDQLASCGTIPAAVVVHATTYTLLLCIYYTVQASEYYGTEVRSKSRRRMI